MSRRARPCGTAGSRQRSDSTSPRTLQGAEVNRCGHDPKHRAWPLLRWPEGGAGALASVGTRRVCLGVVALGGAGRGEGMRIAKRGRIGSHASCTPLLPRREARRCGGCAPPGGHPAAPGRSGPAREAQARRAEAPGGRDPGGELRTFPRKLCGARTATLFPRSFNTVCNFCTGSLRPQKGVGGKGLRARGSRPRCGRGQR